MAVNLGINIQRSPNRINQNLREAGALGKFPKLLLDFKDEYYLANGGSKTFANAVTHARAGNATMTDGYGPELLTNGDFSDDSDWVKETGWTIADGKATVVAESGSLPTDLRQTVSFVEGRTYVVEYKITDAGPDPDGLISFGSLGDDQSITSNGVYYKYLTASSNTTKVEFRITGAGDAGDTYAVDYVSVREMPVIKWAPHNLLTQSQNFSAWSATATTITSNAAVAPDGTQTADEITHTSTTAVFSRNSEAIYDGAKVGVTVFAKYVDHQWFRVFADSGSAWFDLSAGTVGSSGQVTSADITDVGNGWFRCDVIASQSGATMSISLLLADGNGSSVESSGTSAYIWGAHVYRADLGGMVDNPDQPSSRASYVPTTSAAKYLPRIGHHVYSSAWVNEGVLAESESRTNLVPYSDFSSGYTEARTTLTADQTISPDGTENAAEFVETTDAGTHYIGNSITVTASVDYTLSVYVKQGSGSRSAILRTNNEGSDDYVVFDFSSETITETGSGASNETSQDVGNGWYRIAFTYTQSADTGSGFIVALSNSTTPSSSLPSYTGDGSSSLFVYGAQFEQASTPSSLIPTLAGSTVTRAAETFTIPSANLPWPTPQYIGSELVTNGGFDTDSDWTKGTGWSISGGVASHDSSLGAGDLDQALNLTVGSVYEITVQITATDTTEFYFKEDTGSFSLITGSPIGTHTYIFVAGSSVQQVGVRGSGNWDGSVDNISIRKINPLSVSIGMEGRMTYADEDSFAEITVWGDDSSGTDGIQHYLDTRSTETGQIVFRQEANNVVDDVATSGTLYSAGVLVPFNISARHGSTFVNGCADGVSLTANTTPTALPDLSAEDLDFAHDYMGTVSSFRVWDRDITDDGLEEATNPSLEPSLSLTFEGVGTNSFVVNDWSE